MTNCGNDNNGNDNNGNDNSGSEGISELTRVLILRIIFTSGRLNWPPAKIIFPVWVRRPIGKMLMFIDIYGEADCSTICKNRF